VVYGGNIAVRTISGTVTDGGDTFSHCAACAGSNGTGALDADYILSVGSGRTSVVLTWSGTAAVCVLEFSHTNAAVFDAGNWANDSSSSTSNPAPALTISGTNDAFVQFAFAQNSMTGAISGGYTNNADATTDGVGCATLVNQSSYTAPNWTQSPAGTASVGVLALKQ